MPLPEAREARDQWLGAVDGVDVDRGDPRVTPPASSISWHAAR